MQISQQSQMNISASDASFEKTKIPVSSRTPPTYHRRLSLTTAASIKQEQPQRLALSPPVKR